MLKTSSLVKELLTEMDKLPIIDCHEHLVPEADTVPIARLLFYENPKKWYNL
jgi:glucuronate isomerase